MAHSLLEQRAAYPLAAYNFRVLIDAQPMSFAKISGLQRGHGTLTYRHGLSFAEGQDLVHYSTNGFSSISLEQGSGANVRFLYEWVATRKPRMMEINLCDAAGTPALGWRISRAYAIRLSAPTLDAQTNEAAINVLEVMATGITVVHH
ncbi:MAG: phage tail protein [Myxococcales bacterium]|nr:phage tail protein [Myxococcales bacterium]